MQPRGFSFPFRIDPDTGGVAVSTGTGKLRDNLLFLLQVDVGERVLQRDYGAGLRRALHEPMAGPFLTLIKARIIQTITQHEPRIELLDVHVDAGMSEGEVVVELLYVERATRAPERLGFTLSPFAATVHAGGGS